MEPFNYERSQFDRLLARPNADGYLIKVECRTASHSTKWLTATRDQVERIAAILSEERVPKDFPVKPLKPSDPAEDRVTCGTCGRSWDDAISTEWTPAPSARCPFEYFH